MSAIQVRVIMEHFAVCPGDLGHVGDDSRMAVLAAIRHSLFRPGRNVASPAIPPGRCVRCHPTQAAPLHSVESAGGEHAVPACQGCAGNDRQHYQGCEE